MEQNKEKKKKKRERDCLRDFWDNIKYIYIHIIGVPEERRERKGWRKNVKKEIQIKITLTFYFFSISSAKYQMFDNKNYGEFRGTKKKKSLILWVRLQNGTSCIKGTVRPFSKFTYLFIL